MKSLLRVVACFSFCVSLNSLGALLSSTTINWGGVMEAGGSGYASWGNLNIPSDANVESIKLTLTDHYNQYGTNWIKFYFRIDPPELEEFGLNVGEEIDLRISRYLAPFTGINSFEAIMPYFRNDGITTYKWATFEVKAYGEFAPVPLPAGIYLFLSGLVGLGLMRGKKKVSLN